MKRKLDLRTGRPVWMAYRAPQVRVEPLRRDLRTDVLVVGMGISGAMIAEALTADGHAVTMVDRRGPMLGSTPATTALVQFEIDQPIGKLAQLVGRTNAERAWRRSRLALDNLKANIDDLAIRCHATDRRSLYLAGNLLDAAALEKEAWDRRQAGLNATFLSQARLKEDYGIARKGAISSHGNLALDPRLLTAGLLLKASERGARLHAPVEVSQVRHSSDDVEVETAEGPVIRARHVVFATGYELAAGVPDRGHQIISTWAIATRPQKRSVWPNEAFIWEASDPYLYMRVSHDGRVICGGEDEEFQDEERRDALIGKKTAIISRKLAKLMPQIDATPEFAWAGAFGSTATGLPIISALPRKPRVHAVLGYGGNGITWSRIAAEIVTGAVAGREDSDADLFAFPA